MLDFKRPLALWVVVFSLIVATFLGGGLLIRRSVATSFDRIAEIHVAGALTFDLLKTQLDEETGLRGFMVTRDRTFLEPYTYASRHMTRSTPPLELRLLALDLPVAAASLADAETVHAQWVRSVATPLLLGPPGRRDRLELRGKSLVDRLRADLAVVDRQLFGRSRELQHSIDLDLALITVLIVGVALLLAGAAWEFWTLQQRALEDLERERSRAQVQRHETAHHDALTGLPNRAAFLDRLTHALEFAELDGTARVGVLVLDIDRFKIVNDSLGEVAGDQVLVALGHRVSSCLRARDLLARLGGDDFCILLELDQSGHDAETVAERILRALSEPFRIDDQDVLATVSIGIAVSGTELGDAAALLRNAGIAMHRAKQLGGGRYEGFVPDMHLRAVAHSRLELDLRRALNRGELTLVYQPVVTLETGMIGGFEALVRWQHPTRGLVPPVEFIPLAEETGLVVPLGAWVLAEACRQAQTWQGLQPGHAKVSVNVNVAAKQLIAEKFATEGFGADIIRILAETGLDPGQLNLEITESALLDYAEATESSLRYVRSLGVSMQLDDFGTGYSSLSYLQRLPIDTVKIDRSFISGKPEAEITDPQIVAAIVALAKSLGKQVTAEGVETAEQLRALDLLECTNVQGYFISRPLDADAARVFLTTWKPLEMRGVRHREAEKVSAGNRRDQP